MKPDTRPQSEKIAATIRAQIMAGLLQPGSRLPSIPRLAVEQGVSTNTIQNAWQILKNEGYLESETGKGVFVRNRHPFIVDAAAYFEPASRGVTYRLLDVVPEIEPPADVAKALGEKQAVLRHRMTLRDNEPLELSWSYYPLSVAAGTALTGRGRIRGGAPAVLAEAGYPEREFVDQVSSRLPTTEEAELLELPPGLTVLRQLRVVYSDNARPVEVSVLVKGGHMYELRYRQTITS
ncbi:GntR family transcriptional regulator [Streptosporangium sp. NPDC048865]|uniref:GntR family transcriptional regulator n=1 Tax=Streptosporangium sp. NPDC048865 TaxID=3155766 RepID=UPI00343B5A8C